MKSTVVQSNSGHRGASSEQAGRAPYWRKERRWEKAGLECGRGWEMQWDGMRAVVSLMPDADGVHAGIFQHSQLEGSFIGDSWFIFLYYYVDIKYQFLHTPRFSVSPHSPKVTLQRMFTYSSPLFLPSPPRMKQTSAVYHCLNSPILCCSLVILFSVMMTMGLPLVA